MDNKVVPTIEGISVKITFDDLERWGYPSVTDYCRHLVAYAPESGQDLKDKIEIYRGDMLCLTVTDIVEAAKIMPTDRGFKKYDPTKRGARRKASLQPQGDV